MSEATKFHETLTAAGLEYSARSSGGVDIFGSHDSIKAANSAFHSHGNIEGIATNLRHWRDECGKLHAQIAALVAERDALLAIVADLANELEVEIEQRYRDVKQHPAMAPKYERDMSSVRAARAALSPAHQREGK